MARRKNTVDPFDNLPPGWHWHIEDDEVTWWSSDHDIRSLYVAQFPFVPGFFVVQARWSPINSNSLASTVTSYPTAGPFDNVLAAIGAARLLS